MDSDLEKSHHYHPNLNVSLVCPECKIVPPDLVERPSDGDIVCGNCGLVLKSGIIDTRSEWRNFSNEEQKDDPSRVGGPANPYLDEEDLSTTMLNAGRNGHRVDKALNRAQAKTAEYKKDNQLAPAFSKIMDLCEGYQLSKMVLDTAKQLYKLLYGDKLMKNKPLDPIIAAAILLACRKASVPRTFKEIAALTNVPAPDIYRAFKLMKHIIKKRGQESLLIEDNPLSTHTSAQDLIGRFCSHLGFDLNVSKLAEMIVLRCSELDLLSGKSPSTIAASAIYMACTRRAVNTLVSKISEKTGVSEGTIKSAYKTLLSNEAILGF